MQTPGAMTGTMKAVKLKISCSNSKCSYWRTSAGPWTPLWEPRVYAARQSLIQWQYSEPLVRLPWIACSFNEWIISPCMSNELWAGAVVGREGEGGWRNTIGVLGSVGTDSPRDNRHFPVATACPFTLSCRTRRSTALNMHQLSTMLLSPKQAQTVSYPKDNTGQL